MCMLAVEGLVKVEKARMDDVMVVFKAAGAVMLEEVKAKMGDGTMLELMLPTKVVLADEVQAHSGEWLDRVRCSAGQCGQAARPVEPPPPHLVPMFGTLLGGGAGEYGRVWGKCGAVAY